MVSGQIVGNLRGCPWRQQRPMRPHVCEAGPSSSPAAPAATDSAPPAGSGQCQALLRHLKFQLWPAKLPLPRLPLLLLLQPPGWQHHCPQRPEEQQPAHWLPAPGRLRVQQSRGSGQGGTPHPPAQPQTSHQHPAIPLTPPPLGHPGRRPLRYLGRSPTLAAARYPSTSPARHLTSLARNSSPLPPVVRKSPPPPHSLARNSSPLPPVGPKSPVPSPPPRLNPSPTARSLPSAPKSSITQPTHLCSPGPAPARAGCSPGTSAGAGAACPSQRASRAARSPASP